jgi:disulfide bond formation protein DsbB
MSINQVNALISILVLIGQIAIVVLLFYFILLRSRGLKLFKFISRNAIPLAFFVALVAVSGSLYYSVIAGFIPCELCWAQRIFIYPQIVILGLAWFKKDKHIIDYSLALISIGALISLYHNYIYYTVQPSNVCSIANPCTQQYILGFNYISIPLASLTALILMGLLLLSSKKDSSAPICYNKTS